MEVAILTNFHEEMVVTKELKSIATIGKSNTKRM